MPFWINIVVAVVAFVITAASGFVIIPYLHRLKCGQTILDIGPNWHKNKQGTPTMGGFMFILGIIVAVITGYVIVKVKDLNPSGSFDSNEGLKLVAGIVMATLFMLVGFIDDYIKVVKKRNLGLRAMQKVFLQVFISVGYLLTLKLLGETSNSVYIPILGWVDLAFMYIPIMVLFIIFVVNSVNLTDGIDGLCGSVTLVASLVFVMILAFLGNYSYELYSMAVAGGCLGFLFWNLNPAKVFMGDTGSMFLGGIIVTLGFATGYHLLIVLVGIIYMVESLSVILQVTSFKLTGKRIFKMSPIHHHFEMCGWNEYKIVMVFSAVTLLAGIIGILAVYL